MRKLDTSLLINPGTPESTQGGPLVLRWYRDPAYRRWEEAKALTARWGLSQRLAKHADEWLKLHGITAFQEIPAVWKTEEEAKRSLQRFITKNPMVRR